MMVSAGLKPPLVTCTLESITNTLSTSCTWQSRFTTEQLRIVAHATRAGLVLAGFDHSRSYFRRDVISDVSTAPASLQPCLGTLGLHIANFEGVGMTFP